MLMNEMKYLLQKLRKKLRKNKEFARNQRK